MDRRIRLQCEGGLHLRAPSTTGKEEKSKLTQNQLHELLESDQARQLVEGAEERGYLEPAELEAFATEHNLDEEEAEQLARELTEHGVEIRQQK